jgi:hypothetical protein
MMRVPKDSELQAQGISRKAFEAMEEEAQRIMLDRSERIIALKNVNSVGQIALEFLREDEGRREQVISLLEGGNPGLEGKIRDVVRKYNDSGVNASITDYVKAKYEGYGFLNEEGSKEETVKTHPEDVKKGGEEEAIGGDDASAAAESPDRIKDIALIMSRWEGKTPDKVMREDADIIGHVMSITDENKALNLTDKAVMKACEAIMKSDDSVHFPMEALMPDRRERLIQIARTYV